MTARRFVVSPVAVSDLRDISLYIEKDSPTAAHRMISRLTDSFLALGRNPGIGHARSDLTTRPILFFAVRSYLVIYDPAPHPIEILRVLHGTRDVASML